MKIWKDFSKKFRDGDHAFLSASAHAWYNYDDEKLVKVYASKLAASRGTALHALACNLIKLKVKLPKINKTLNLYVNDCINEGLRPEEKLFYSKFAYGTADAIDYDKGILKVYDLKTGKTKVSFLQLMIYAALFILCYPEIPLKKVKSIVLRIYQNDEVVVQEIGIDELLPVVDKIKRYSKILEELEENYDDGFDSFGGRS